MEFFKLKANIQALEKLMPIVQFVVNNKKNQDYEINELLV